MYKNKFIIDEINLNNNSIKNILSMTINIKKSNELFDFCKDKYLNNFKLIDV